MSDPIVWDNPEFTSRLMIIDTDNLVDDIDDKTFLGERFIVVKDMSKLFYQYCFDAVKFIDMGA